MNDNDVRVITREELRARLAALQNKKENEAREVKASTFAYFADRRSKYLREKGRNQ